MTKLTKQARRTFLCNLGRFAMATPFASLAAGELMWLRNAVAEDAAPQKKALFVHSPGGAIAREWNPIGCETEYTLPAMSAPLESVKYDCTFLAGVNFFGGNSVHSPAFYSLGDYHHLQTLDVYLAKRLGDAFLYPHVPLALGYADDFVSRDNGGVAFMMKPEQAFHNLFGASPTPASAEMRGQQMILDINLRQLRKMETAFAGEDRVFIQQRISEMEQLALQLQSPGDGQDLCSAPKLAYEPTSDFATQAKAQIDIAVMALKCGLTPVVTLQLGQHEGRGIYFPDTGYPQDLSQAYEGAPPHTYTLMRAEMTRLVAYLIERLAMHKDSSGKRMLDNIMMLHVSSGGDALAHDSLNTPYFFAGGAAGALRTGLNLKANCQSGDVLDTAALAMGVDIEHPDYQPYGTKVVTAALTA